MHHRRDNVNPRKGGIPLEVRVYVGQLGRLTFIRLATALPTLHYARHQYAIHTHCPAFLREHLDMK